MRRIFAADIASSFFMHSSKILAFLTISPGNPKESKNFQETPCHLVLSDSAKACASSTATARASAAAARASAAEACDAATKVCASATSALLFRSATWVSNRLFSLMRLAIRIRSPSTSWAFGSVRIVGMKSSGLTPSSEQICSNAVSIDLY